MYILKQSQVDMKKISLFLVLISILPACVGPKYKVPEHSMPAKFAYQEQAKTVEPLAKWWQQFGDRILNKLVCQAVKTNYDLAIAVEKIEETRALYRIKLAELFPQVDVVSEISRTRFGTFLDDTFIEQKNTFSLFQFGFDAFWEIDIWGRIWHAKKARYYSFQAQIEQMRDVFIILLADVARTYIDLCTFEKLRSLLSRKVELDTQLVMLQKDLLASGLASNIDVFQQDQELATSQDQLNSIVILVGQAKNQLAVLLGMNPEFLRLPVCAQVPFSDAPLAVGIPSDLLRRRPDIRKAERELAASNELVGQAIAEFFPQFTLTGRVLTEANSASDFFGTGSLGWMIGWLNRWPFLNFGRLKFNVKAKKSVFRQTALAYNKTIINALKDVENFLLAYNANKRQYVILNRKLQDAITQEELIEDKLASGLESKLQYLLTQKNRIERAIEVTTIQQGLSTNLVSLYKALGGGW